MVKRNRAFIPSGKLRNIGRSDARIESRANGFFTEA
jgi:hypothetical protein